MFLGNVNTFRKSLSKFKEIISQKYRREILCNLISNEISKLEEIDKKKIIFFLVFILLIIGSIFILRVKSLGSES